MANARQIVQHLIEANDPDSPENFDVKSHLDSPVARLAKTNGFVRNDRSEDEERWVKKLSDGKEVWLRTRPHSEYMPERPMNLQDPESGRHWDFLQVSRVNRCDYCQNDRPANKSLCPHCKQSRVSKPGLDYTTLVATNEVAMNYLLGAILQRLATWPENLPKPGQPGWKKAFEHVDEPPAKEHVIHMGRPTDCLEHCQHCGAYCTLLHYKLPNGVQMPQYHICQTCDVKSAEVSEGVDDPDVFLQHFEPRFFVVANIGPLQAKKTYWGGMGEPNHETGRGMWHNSPLDVPTFTEAEANAEVEHLKQIYLSVGSHRDLSFLASELASPKLLDRWKKQRERQAQRRKNP